MSDNISKLVVLRQGETVHCRNGHPVAKAKQDVFFGDRLLPHMFDLLYSADTEMELLLHIGPNCPKCNDEWIHAIHEKTRKLLNNVRKDLQ